MERLYDFTPRKTGLLHFWETLDGKGGWKTFERSSEQRHNVTKCIRMGGGCIDENERRNFSGERFPEGILKNPGNWIDETNAILPSRQALPLLFMDAEFCDIEAKEIKFLSLALVKETGEKVYLEFDRKDSKCSQWVIENVYPLLWSSDEGFYTTKEDEARKIILAFLGGKKYQLVADVNQFDWIAWCNFWGGVFKQPLHYIPLDLSTKLAVKKFDPDCDRQIFGHNLGIECDSAKKHNALEDAKLCRSIWKALDKY